MRDHVTSSKHEPVPRRLLRIDTQWANGGKGRTIYRFKNPGHADNVPALGWSSAGCFQMFGGNGLLRTARLIFPPDCIEKGHHLGW
jgi:hypothetical protein